MKNTFSFFLILLILAAFTGCYTELATMEPAEPAYVLESDTTVEDENTIINNHYYLDDDYRRSRLRVSFNYYYPTYSSWISSYYHSYFNDYYWGMYHRPSWYYDPFYTYYPPYGWCYPAPIYDPWYPYYYPPVVFVPVYYPVYDPSPGYAGGPINPGRPRTDGPTRFPDGGDRPRPNGSFPIETMHPVADNGSDDAAPIQKPSIRGPEKPWWEKLPDTRPVVKPTGEARPVEVGKVDKPSDMDSPAIIDRPKPSGEDRPVAPTVNDRPAYQPPANDRPNRDDRPVERPKNNKPTVKPPVKQTVPKDEARPVQKPSVTRKPSYSPPPRQSSPPQSTPPRSSGGSSSTGSNGRKRD